MRQFSQTLKLDPSFLSKLLSGKRLFSYQTVLKCILGLGLDRNEAKKILSLFGPKVEEKSLRKKRPNFTKLELSKFESIAKWYYVAILEMVNLNGFEPNTRYIARTLKIKESQAQEAIQRMLELGLLKRTQGGELVSSEPHRTTLGSAETALALKQMQISVLQKATEAVLETNPKVRDQTTMTFVSDPDLIEEAKLRITKFRRELTSFLENTPNKKTVFHLTIGLYPVSFESGDVR